MNNRSRIVTLMCGLLLAGSVSAFAQPRWGRGPEPRAGVCFYQDINFRGSYFCARSGESFGRVPEGTNDHISSIRVFGNADVIVFKDARFRGSSARFTTSVRDLRREGWNDRISSARVTAAFAGPGAGRGGSGNGPVWGHAPMPREGACFFKDVNFDGDYFCVRRGDSYELMPPGFNDQISSIRVMGAVVMVFTDRDYGGRSTRVERNVRNLRESLRDRVSSLRVF